MELFDYSHCQSNRGITFLRYIINIGPDTVADGQRICLDEYDTVTPTQLTSLCDTFSGCIKHPCSVFVIAS